MGLFSVRLNSAGFPSPLERFSLITLPEVFHLLIETDKVKQGNLDVESETHGLEAQRCPKSREKRLSVIGNKCMETLQVKSTPHHRLNFTHKKDCTTALTIIKLRAIVPCSPLLIFLQFQQPALSVFFSTDKH